MSAEYKFDPAKSKLGYGAIDIVVNMYTPEIVAAGKVPTDERFRDQVRDKQRAGRSGEDDYQRTHAGSPIRDPASPRIADRQCCERHRDQRAPHMQRSTECRRKHSRPEYLNNHHRRAAHKHRSTQ